MLNIFKSKSKEKAETKALLAALYTVLGADNEGSDKEYEFFYKVCNQKGFSKEEISEVISNNSILSKSVPTEKNKQDVFFDELLSMVIADGSASTNEVKLLEKYAKMMNLAGTDEGIATLVGDIIRKKLGS